MSSLTNKGGNNCIRFIVDWMIHCRDNLGRPHFYSSFVQMNLQLNGIECKKYELIESPKILDYGVVAKRRYYMDLSGDYPYLEDSGGKIYNDNIVE